ncbi:PhnD/SsuA/transferrin family substrate-binding protein [Halosimplex sp. TS25]|uniref:PhnD/SsuA/transferrin family substrate-binding protein n=1 Tax=Halosimplex rarum TaxID=3396619 RepID=UPI0039ECFE5F
MSDQTRGQGSTGTGSTGSGRVNRRTFLAGGASSVAALVALSGCSSSSGAGGTDGGSSDGGSGSGGSTDTDSGGGAVVGTPGPNAEEITMVLTPGTPSDAKRRYMPMKNLIEGEVDGVDVTMRVPLNYSAIRPALQSEQAEIGMDDVTLISNPDIMDVYGTTVTGGSAFYFSVMLTQPDSDVEGPADVEGKSWAFADRLSTSGSIFALYALQEAGLDIGEAPTGDPVDFEGSWSDHNQAIQRVANDKAIGATTWGGNGLPHIPEKYESDFPDRVKNKSSFLDTIDSEEPKLRPVWFSFPIPKQPVYARKTWDSSKKAEIGEVLVNSDKDLIEQYYPSDYNEEDLPFTTLQDTDMETYQPVIKRMNAVGIDPAA